MDLLGNIYRMEKFIKVAFKMGNAMEKESLFGLINIPMKVIGRMDVNMEKEKRYLLMEKYQKAVGKQDFRNKTSKYKKSKIKENFRTLEF